MTIFFQFVTFALPSPSYFLFFLVRVASLSLSGGTSCHRSTCRCIPLVTGLRGPRGTSGNALKDWGTLGSRECCSNAQKYLPGLCKNCIRDTMQCGIPVGDLVQPLSHPKEKLYVGIFCCKEPEACQGVKYECTIPLRCTRAACAGGLWAMKDMYPCGCVPGSRWGEPMQTRIWDSKLLARASSSVAHESRKLIFLVIRIVFPWKATFCMMLKCGSQIEKKPKH